MVNACRALVAVTCCFVVACPDRKSVSDEAKTATWLYLSFVQRAHPTIAQTAWLHPTEKPDATYEEEFAPGKEREHPAFAVQIVREAAEGYEVAFAPIDPDSEQRLSLPETRHVFHRTDRSPFQLTPETSVYSEYKRQRGPLP